MSFQKMEVVFSKKCITCDAVLGNTFVIYREMLNSGILHNNIVRELGVDQQCCLQSLDLKCSDKYQESLIKRSTITSGRSPIISVIEASRVPVTSASTTRRIIESPGIFDTPHTMAHTVLLLSQAF